MRKANARVEPACGPHMEEMLICTPSHAHAHTRCVHAHAHTSLCSRPAASLPKVGGAGRLQDLLPMDAAQDRIIEAVVRADHILAFVRRAIRATAGPKTELTDDIQTLLPG